MKVSLACNLINFDVSAELEFLYNTNAVIVDRNAYTTAWFIKILSKWFRIMSSRCDISAISKSNLREYKNTLKFLKEIIVLFKNINSGNGGYCKPVQTGTGLTFVSKNYFRSSGILFKP